ncbi:IS4 family transposase [Halomonas ventosae]|uniref:IS4 family transposase n=1 Tax=Halomonas ventosae TaxID=229007 RepID=A0A2T0VQD2_9GAMM|nr:IS4 family transposase [Halomonas ventosae]PRY72687.1 IS4 family transposase [Halomonas ventosae]
MQTSRFLHKILTTSAAVVHRARFNALATCVHALLEGQSLTLTSLGRQLPRQIQPKHAIKCVDRLLGNAHLQRERRWLYADVARLLVGAQRHPIILVDWSPIDDRGRHFLLRAAIPFGKRSFPIYERVHHKDACPRCQKALLADLAWMLPPQAKPILITDAGFKTPWLRAVEAYGWYYIGRVRGATQLRHDGESDWRRLESLFPLATREPASRGPITLAKTRSLATRLYLYRAAYRGRKDRNKNGSASRAARSRKAAKGHREPWVLVSNLTPRHNLAANVVKLYAKRMEIEEGFRDIKSERFGFAFNLHGTRHARRIEILLLIAMLASFRLLASGLALETAGKAPAYQSNTRRSRRGLSLWRLGGEAILARYPAGRTERLIRLMRQEAALAVTG